MALNAYAEMTANGNVLDGNTSVSELGGIDVSNDHIECFSVNWGSQLNNSSSFSRWRGGITKLPVILLKPIDKTTPLLYQAMSKNQLIDGSIKLFDIDPDSGSTRHFFTVKLYQARLSSINSVSPNTLSADNVASPPTEQVEIVAQTLTYIDEINNVEYESG